MAVEVYSNLLSVTPALWETFELAGVSLATSYSSSDAAEHDAITGRRSHGRTWASIVEATRRGIVLRVGMVAVSDGQHVDAAVARLHELGITAISVDHVRRVGRGRGGRDTDYDIRELCGQCARAQLMIGPDGTAYPCTMCRWLPLGNVRTASLAAIHADALPVRLGLTRIFASRGHAVECDPAGQKREGDGNCNLCDPAVKQLPKCAPHRPRERCGPDPKRGPR
jgi:MoaA/NifB/PqqE/SkfB family radical SAM enzyme